MSQLSKINFNEINSVKQLKGFLVIADNDKSKCYEEIEALNEEISTCENKDTKKRLLAELKELEKEPSLIEYEKFILSVKYVSSKMYNIFLKISDTNEVYIVRDLKNNKTYSLGKNNLLVFIKNKVQEEFKVYNKKFSARDLVELYVKEEILQKEIFDLGYYPDEKVKIFEFENNVFLNTFKAGKFEKEFRKYNWQKLLDNEKAYEKYNFPLIDKLIRHLTGDQRVFLEETIKLFSNPEHNELAENEIYFTLRTLDKNNMESENLEDLYKEVVKECEKRLALITSKDLLNYNINVQYFYKWLAFILQNPCSKLPNGIGFKTTQGAGKDRLIEWVFSEIWGEENISSIGQSDLNEKFNGYIQGKKWIIANELEYSKEHSQMYESLKRLMTNSKVSLRAMHKQQYNIQNFSHFLFFGNHDNMLRIEKKDRRYTLYEQPYILPKLVSYTLSPDLKDYKGNLLNPETLSNELKEFTSFLYELKVNFNDVERPLETEVKKEIQDFHKTDIEVFLEKFKEFDSMKQMLNYYDKIEDNNYFNGFANNNLFQENLISNNVLYKLFKVVCREEGFNTRRSSRSFNKQMDSLGYRSNESPSRCNFENKITKTKNIEDFNFIVSKVTEDALDYDYTEVKDLHELQTREEIKLYFENYFKRNKTYNLNEFELFSNNELITETINSMKDSGDYAEHRKGELMRLY